MAIVDAHLDLAFNALRHGRDLLKPINELREHEIKIRAPALKTNGTALVTIPALREAGVSIVFSSLFVPPSSYPGPDAGSRFVYSTQQQAFTLAMEQMDYYHRLADEVDNIRIVTDKPGLQEVLTSADEGERLLGIVMMMEGADPIREPAEAEMWYERGLRMIALAWDDTRYSAGAWRDRGGLTKDGRYLLEVMEDLGCILDLTHLSDQAANESLDSFGGALLASHSNVRQIVPTPRQLSDQQIYRIAERGGVIGIAMFNQYLKAGHKQGDPRQLVTIDHVTAHIDHICQLLGSSSHVGIGTDFDGGFGLEDVPEEINGINDLKLIEGALLERGYSHADVEKIMSGNWLRVLNEALPD